MHAEPQLKFHRNLPHLVLITLRMEGFTEPSQALQKASVELHISPQAILKSFAVTSQQCPNVNSCEAGVKASILIM